jgi:phosphatidylserine decarboxylase
MKKMISKMKVYLAIMILAGLMVPSSIVLAGADAHKPITRELINLLEKNPEIREMLAASIAEAKKINPDPKTNPVQSLSEYYDFVDRASELIPRDILYNPTNLTRDQIDQAIHYPSFLVGQPIPQLENKGLYRNSLQYYEPFAAWMRKFAQTWGAFLDTKDSWNEKMYQEFYKDPRFGLAMGWYESPDNWKTFNQFFSRYLKSPAARPIASPDDPTVVVSAADSVPQGVWKIDGNSNIQIEGGLKVKLITYYSIKDLLGKDSQYKDAFANGVLTHAYLNPYDYHRYHFPVGGIVKEKKNISQNVAVEVVWDPEEGKYLAIDSTGWQFTQTRGYVIVDTGKYGLVALIPMGMDFVSSVNFEDNVKVGTTHKKGDMLGTFKFGGSDFIILFQEKAGFEITAPTMEKIVTKPGSHLRHKITNYKHLLMGEEYGVMKGSNS